MEKTGTLVLLKMDKVRHFIFVKDKLSFAEKKDQAIFRGKIACKDIRVQFVEKFSEILASISEP